MTNPVGGHLWWWFSLCQINQQRKSQKFVMVIFSMPDQLAEKLSKFYDKSSWWTFWILQTSCILQTSWTRSEDILNSVTEFFISKRDPLSFEILTIFLHSGSQGDLCLFCFNDSLVGWWVDLVMITKVCFLWWLVKKLCLNPLQAVGQWRHLLVPQGHLQWVISWSGDDY